MRWPQSNPPSARRAAAQLCGFARDLYERGWMEGTSGNLSVKLAGSRSGPAILITPTGLSKGHLRTRDVVRIDVESGRQLSRGPRASSEAPIHRALYADVESAAAVVHVHSPCAVTVATWAGREGHTQVNVAGQEIAKGLSATGRDAVSLLIVANDADSEMVASELAMRLRAEESDAPCVLIHNHGATGWGTSLQAAVNRLECLELLCRVAIDSSRADPAKLLEPGGPR